MSQQQFGPNTWLIEEMYRQYLEDPQSVSEAWQDFFEDYEPRGNGRIYTRMESEPSSTRQPAQSAPPATTARPLTGADAAIAKNMEQSLNVPTATSVRSIPAKLLEVNRNILNNHLSRSTRRKVSFTHIIGWAIAGAVKKHPEFNSTYSLMNGKPHVEREEALNLGIAIDIQRKDGPRTLVAPNIRSVNDLGFAEFVEKYEDLVSRAHAGKLTADDFSGTTITITNPGTLGTAMSVPRLMEGQAAIVGVGAIQYPAEYLGADPATLAEIGVGKVVTLTSTYDHRVIQGAVSGEFLAEVERLLLGEDNFYEELFDAMKVPYVPVRWRRDSNPSRDSIDDEEKHAKVLGLIHMYRVRGHLIADLDPLDTKPPHMHPELDPASHGLTIWDLEREFITGGFAGRRRMKLGDILGLLRDSYCRTLTVEYMHIEDPEQKAWIQSRIETPRPKLDHQDQMHILRRLNQADAFETFLHTKYVGHKRFSLEGAETLIPMLDAILDGAARSRIGEVVIGMSHRGRLNVLANIVGKSYAQIFREFEGDIDPATAQGSGDVKYHIGAIGTFSSRAGASIGVTVASNPSHLEGVNPVVEGMVRAKQDSSEAGDAAAMGLLIHGDAAFAGQGVVAETLNLSGLRGYETGGTVHIIVNNQLGFTTGSDYGRSSTYASDVARMVQAPIFHVNGEDPEACVRAATLAFEFRQAFQKDVVVDMWCYRRWGHNEADEPSFTQPLMYERIRNRRSIRKQYTEDLVNRGDLTLEEAERSLLEHRQTLQQAFDQTKGESQPGKPGHFIRPIGELPKIATSVARPVLDRVLGALTSIPEGFALHPKLARWIEDRARALDSDDIDWSLGEALAIGTLLLDGVPVRLSGQDTRRGTFSQRHSTLVDQTSGEEFVPLAACESDGSRFFVYDSLLSEFAALGFEYGYSVGNPRALVLWEAQFGDFANGAQVVFDQFIVAGEDKWAQRSGLVALLPHGYEGQGPEHSSARLERFLQLAAEDNIQVAVPTTPSQMFHLLRRQAFLGDIRKPLVILTPKSFLRLPAAGSKASDLTDGGFHPVLLEKPRQPDVKRVLLCSGKVYYDLAAHREKEGHSDVAIVRIEQLYPFPSEDLERALSHFPNAGAVWVQEEPANMGAWLFLRVRFEDELGVKLEHVSRPESASPATGSATAHSWEQARLLESAFSRT